MAPLLTEFPASREYLPTFSFMFLESLIYRRRAGKPSRETSALLQGKPPQQQGISGISDDVPLSCTGLVFRRMYHAVMAILGMMIAIAGDRAMPRERRRKAAEYASLFRPTLADRLPL